MSEQIFTRLVWLFCKQTKGPGPRQDKISKTQSSIKSSKEWKIYFLLINANYEC